MRWTYDMSADAFYFRFSNAAVVAQDELASGVIVDLDDDEKVVGVEVLCGLSNELRSLEKVLERTELLSIVWVMSTPPVPRSVEHPFVVAGMNHHESGDRVPFRPPTVSELVSS